MGIARRTVGRRVRVLAAVAALSAGRAAVAEPFAVNVDVPSGPNALRVSGSSLGDLANNLVKTQGQFSTLGNTPFDASVRYGGLNDAVLYSQNATGTQATVTIPTTGFSRTFTAANQSDLRDQIRDFLRTDGSDEYARFLRSINERTQIGVTDGNPLATTALLSDMAYDEFGLHRRPFFDPADTERVAAGLHVDLKGGVFDTGDSSGSGWFGSATVTSGFRLGDRVGLRLGGLFSYRDLDGGSTYHAGTMVGLPVSIIPMSGGNGTGNSGVSWEVTPAFLAGASGSLDQAAGGTFLGGSVTSSLSLRAAPFTFAVANQVSFLEGYPIDVGDYDFDTDLSQQILKNGIKVSYDLGPGAFLDGGVTYTNFLKDAAVSSYWTPTVGVGLRFGPDSGLRVAYEGHFGDGYNAHGGVVQLYLNH
ncbi:MAG TPA: hypothetical protein VF796_03920 [Humisphaera sp.]